MSENVEGGFGKANESNSSSCAKHTVAQLRSRKNQALKRRRIKAPSARLTQKTKIDIFNRDIAMVEERHKAEMTAIKMAEKRAIVQHTVSIANMRAAAAMEMKVLRHTEKYRRAHLHTSK